jgi:hypothetical protein
MEVPHVLSERSERAKRNLFLISIVCIFFGLGDHLPGEIPFFQGLFVKSDSQKNLVTWGLVLGQLYLLLRFSSMALVDLRNSRKDLSDFTTAEKRKLNPLAKDIKGAARWVLTWMDYLSYRLTIFLNRFNEIYVPILVGFVGFYFATEIPELTFG